MKGKRVKKARREWKMKKNKVPTFEEPFRFPSVPSSIEVSSIEMNGRGKVETKFFPSFLSILLSVFVFCFTSLLFTPRSDFLSTVCYLLLFSLYFLSQWNKRVKVLSHFVLHSDSIFGSSKKERNKREERTWRKREMILVVSPFLSTRKAVKYSFFTEIESYNNPSFSYSLSLSISFLYSLVNSLFPSLSLKSSLFANSPTASTEWRELDRREFWVRE